MAKAILTKKKLKEFYKTIEKRFANTFTVNGLVYMHDFHVEKDGKEGVYSGTGIVEIRTLELATPCSVILWNGGVVCIKLLLAKHTRTEAFLTALNYLNKKLACFKAYHDDESFLQLELVFPIDSDDDIIEKIERAFLYEFDDETDEEKQKLLVINELCGYGHPYPKKVNHGNGAKQ